MTAAAAEIKCHMMTDTRQTPLSVYSSRPC